MKCFVCVFLALFPIGVAADPWVIDWRDRCDDRRLELRHTVNQTQAEKNALGALERDWTIVPLKLCHYSQEPSACFIQLTQIYRAEFEVIEAGLPEQVPETSNGFWASAANRALRTYSTMTQGSACSGDTSVLEAKVPTVSSTLQLDACDAGHDLQVIRGVARGVERALAE